MRDIQRDPRFRSGKWFVFFVDFKSAFDKVDHMVLFKKLERSGISERTINILKLLYNSYQFSLLEGKPMKINSGVAQGSLVSPLLYNWYINDLICDLSLEHSDLDTPLPTLMISVLFAWDTPKYEKHSQKSKLGARIMALF